MRQVMATHFASKAHQWKQRGRIYLWRYLENTRNYPDWHLSLDPAAHESLTTLFRAFCEEGLKCKRTLVVTAPPAAVLQVPNNQGGKARFTSPAKIRLSYEPDLERVWTIDAEADPLDWRIGPGGAAEVRSVLDEPHRYFDENFGGEPSIWWWGVTRSAA